MSEKAQPKKINKLVFKAGWILLFIAVGMTVLTPLFIYNQRHIPLTKDEWEIEYDGYGKVEFIDGEIIMEPKPVTGASDPSQRWGPEADTHSVLIYSKRFQKKPLRNFRMTIVATTESQVRENAKPNDWEVFWPLFNVKRGKDGFMEFNYFILKPTTGLELGTAFSEFGQQYMQMVPNPKLEIGKTNKYVIEKRDDTVAVWIDDALAMHFTGKNKHGHGIFDVPGSIGLYSEDARVRISSVWVQPL